MSSQAKNASRITEQYTIYIICQASKMKRYSQFVSVGCLFNGTSTQKGQFVATAGEGNGLSRLRMAHEIQFPYVTR